MNIRIRSVIYLLAAFNRMFHKLLGGAPLDIRGGCGCITYFGALVDVELEVAFLDDAVGEDHLAIAMLNATDPFALVDASVRPFHLAIAVSLVLLVFTLVGIAAGPREHPIAMLLVIQVVSFVLVARLGALGALPTALSVLETLTKFTHIEGPVFPGVLSFAIRFALFVFSRIGVPIFKDVGPLSMLQTLTPLALISISIFPGVHTIALRL